MDFSRLRMRMMRGVKSQLAVETANRSHFDDEALLQREGISLSGMGDRETLNFPRPLDTRVPWRVRLGDVIMVK